ncbi:MAG: antibiotic biosynthesis monooxygenase [Bacteroidetes bacterium]|nr:antibiotic biosynthesis monooxygenase [Bacteroidota bacterium]
MLRIVKMSFDQERTAGFIDHFKKIKPTIESMPGCLGVKLLRDKGNPNIFFTYSEWVDENALNAYRSTPFFSETWTTVKQWFNDKPEAWSVDSV